MYGVFGSICTLALKFNYILETTRNFKGTPCSIFFLLDLEIHLLPDSFEVLKQAKTFPQLFFSSEEQSPASSKTRKGRRGREKEPQKLAPQSFLDRLKDVRDGW